MRVVPLVNGTFSGHGGSRMVPGRSQYSSPPTGGRNRNVSGPNPPPKPHISNSRLQTTTFWNTTGWVHQFAMSLTGPIPGVVAMNTSPTARYPAIFST